MTHDDRDTPTSGDPASTSRNQPLQDSRRRCPGTTKSGAPCRATPTQDGLCPNHSPRFTSAERSAWGRRGGEKMIRKRMLREAVAEAPVFPLRVAATLVPCHFDTARRTLRRYKHDFPPPSYSVVNARRVRMVSASDIQALRRIILSHLLRGIQASTKRGAPVSARLP
jgi:hypothetical protein